MPAPDRYPLPWCDKLDVPYWRVNLLFCATVDGWRKWQAHRAMAEIIPEIDKKFTADSSLTTQEK